MNQVPIFLIISGLVLGTVAILAMTIRFRTSIMMITAMSLFAALAVQREEGLVSNTTIFKPLQLLRAELFLASGAALLAGCIINMAKLRVSVFPSQSLFFLLVHLYAGLIRTVHMNSATEWLTSAAFDLTTFMAVILVVPPLLSERSGWYALLRGLVLAGAIWCGMVFVQMVVDRHQLLVDWGRRLTGMHGQPQAAAQYLCFVATMSMWLALNDPKRSLRSGWIALTAVSLVFVAWTGSRSGAIMTVIGLAFVLWARAGKAVLLLPIVGGFIIVASTVIKGSSQDLGVRLIDTTDTRSVVWRQLIDQFIANPLIGTGIQKAVENSYLLGLGAYGILMGFLLLLLLIATWTIMARIWVGRRSLTPEFRQWVWLILGINCTYFIGANADGFIVSRLETTHVILLVFAGYGTALARMTVGRWPMVDATNELVDSERLDDSHLDSEAGGYEPVTDASLGEYSRTDHS
jgi:O-antigen ligase